VGQVVTGTSKQAADTVEVVEYDSVWPERYAAERDRILTVCGPRFVAFEHIGSTAVPGLRAKPIIDMMAAVRSLREASSLVETLDALGYHVLETGMRNRLFLRRRTQQHGFHLHIVEHATWDERKERLMRDFLRVHREAAEAYGALKDKLAAMYTHDSLGYTKAKTEFIQGIIDEVRDARGLPRVDVWED